MKTRSVEEKQERSAIDGKIFYFSFLFYFLITSHRYIDLQFGRFFNFDEFVSVDIKPADFPLRVAEIFAVSAVTKAQKGHSYVLADEPSDHLVICDRVAKGRVSVVAVDTYVAHDIGTPLVGNRLFEPEYIYPEP